MSEIEQLIERAGNNWHGLMPDDAINDILAALKLLAEGQKEIRDSAKADAKTAKIDEKA